MVRGLLPSIIVALGFTCLAPSPAHAQGNGPGFHAAVRFDGGCPVAASQTASGTAPPVTVAQGVPCISGTANAIGQADARSLRALTQTAHECCGTVSGATGRARIQVENVVITGPPAPAIPVSLNFRVQGELIASPDFGQAGLMLFIGLSGFNTLFQSTSQIDFTPSGILNQTGVFAPVPLGFPSAAFGQPFATPTINAAPNQPLRLDLELMVYSDMAGHGATQADFFSGTNGVSLPLGVPVFNLPPGYTVTIPELNIVDNFVALPAIFDDDIFIVGTNASQISLPSVGELTGSVTVTGNGLASSIDLGSLATVGGTVNVSENVSASSIDLGSLTTVSGTVNVSENATASSIDLGSLTTVGGTVNVSENAAASTIDLGSLTTVGGALSIDGNTATTTIDLSSLSSVSGAVSIDNNGSLTSIDLSSVETVDGTVSIDDNDSTTSLDLGSLQTAGAVQITENGVMVTLDLGSLVAVAGDVTIAGNGPCTNIGAGSLATVGGNLSIESCGTGAFTPGPVAAAGNTTLATAGYSTVSGTTAAGATTVRNAQPEAMMTVRAPAGSFATPVSFSVVQLEPATLVPEPGIDAGGAPATVDPVAGYRITFGVPALNQPATLIFDVYLAGLDTATSAALLGAAESGQATLATRGDVPGSQYQAFPICADSEVPAVDGCVKVEPLDSSGHPATGTPAIIRFSNVVGHFSTWTVAIITPDGAADTTAPVIADNVDLVLAATSAAGAVAAYAPPAATDDSSDVNVSCVPGSGSVFPIGRTTVVCTATDQAGNTATSDFSVAVLCCSVGIAVEPVTAKRGELVWVTARIRNHSAYRRLVVLELQLSGPMRSVEGAIPLALPPGIDQSIRLPLRVPRGAPLGAYQVILITRIGDDSVRASATLTVVQ